MARVPFTVDEYVRWSDVDHAGIIFYGAYVRFFEIAETELFRCAGVPYGEVFDRFAIWLPRVHLSCDFSHPARLDDQLRVAAYITRFGRSSIELKFDVALVSARTLTAVGTEVLVSTSRKTMRSIPIPEKLREALTPFLFSQADARAALGITAIKVS